MTLTTTIWDVIHPHRKTPWAAVLEGPDGPGYGVYDPDTGRSARIDPGTDPALPGLSYWISRARLVSYRPHRRATLTGHLEGRPVFIKVVSPFRLKNLRNTYALMTPVISAASMQAPELVAVDTDTNAMAFAALEGDVLHARRPWIDDDVQEVGQRLAVFGSALPPDGLEDRASPDLAWWVEQVETRDPAPSSQFQAHLGVVVAGFPPYRPSRHGPIHGDLHDKNLVINQGAVGLLDLDSAGLGDSLQDLATLTAHFELRALQATEEPPDRIVAALWEGYRSISPNLAVAEARSATARELARLACLYRFRRSWRSITDSLVDRAALWNEQAQVKTRVSKRHRAGARNPDSALRAVLEPQRLTEELAELWDRFEWIGSKLISADVVAVHEREGDYTLDLRLEVGRDDGPCHVPLLGEIVEDEVEDRARSTLVQLQRRSRGQLLPSGSDLAAVPSLRLLVRRPGLDRRLPVLDLLHRPKRAKSVLAPYIKNPEVELVGHRLEKRAILRAVRDDQSVIVKGYKARSTLPELVMDWARRLRRVDGGALTPAPIGLLSDRRAVVWENVGSHVRHEWDPVKDPKEIESVGAALRSLHEVNGLDLPLHGVPAEIEVIGRSLRLLQVGRPRLAGVASEIFQRLRTELSALDARPPTPVHRDAHPGQFLVTNDGVTIIDLDSLSAGDPATDLGNYSAYLELVVASGSDLVLHNGYQSDAGIVARSMTWKKAALFRLACQLALTTDRAEEGAQVLVNLRTCDG